MRTINFTVPEQYDEKPLLSFLKEEARLSLGLIRSLKHYDNGMLLNGVHIRTIDIIHKGDTVTLNLPEEKNEVTPCEMTAEVIYEDEDILVVNKPPMLPIHESHNHQGDTLQNEVACYLKQKGKSSSFHAIGRLDKGTSGLVLCALNRYSASLLSGKIEKQYLAIPTGVYTESGTIDARIYRPDSMKTYRIVDNRGDDAVTHYEPIGNDGEKTLVRVKLETGRTHQIRVHFAYLGTALYGDTMYGKKAEDISHQCLHCEKISFIHPVTREKITLACDMPQDMKGIADKII